MYSTYIDLRIITVAEAAQLLPLLKEDKFLLNEVTYYPYLFKTDMGFDSFDITCEPEKHLFSKVSFKTFINEIT